MEKKNKLPEKYRKALWSAITKTDNVSIKSRLVYTYTNQRTDSLSDMMIEEATSLLYALHYSVDQYCKDARTKMIRTIYSLAYQMNITVLKNGEVKADTKRLNQLVKRLSPQKKVLNQHSYEELIVLVTIVRKYYREGLNKGGFYEGPGA